MAFPEFFARVAPVTLRDPLAELLGAAAGGLIDHAADPEIVQLRPRRHEPSMN